MSGFRPNASQQPVVVRLSALGDVILTTGVLRQWHEQFGWVCTVVTRQAFAPVFTGHPGVREVLPVRDEDLRGIRLLSRWRELARTCAGQPLIDLHGTGRTFLLAALWRGATTRYPKRGLQRRLFLRTGGRFGSGLVRETVPQRYALAVAKTPPPAEALRPQIYLSQAELAAGQDLARKLVQCGDHPVLTFGLTALHPYAAHAGKTWPRDDWLALIQQLDRHGLPWCVIGRSPDRLCGDAEFRDRTNLLSLRESAALLSACNVLVTGDSGPMHLAAAVSTPVVALFGSTSREWGFYPGGELDVVLELDMPCRPCDLHGSRSCARDYACMRDIPVSQVLDALTGLAN